MKNKKETEKSDWDRWAEHIRKYATDPPREGFEEMLKKMSEAELIHYVYDFAGNYRERNLATAEYIGRGLNTETNNWESQLRRTGQ